MVILEGFVLLRFWANVVVAIGFSWGCFGLEAIVICQEVLGDDALVA